MCVLIFGPTGWSSRSRPCLRAPRKAPNFNHERRPDCDETGRQVLSCGSPNECSARRESESGTKHGQNYLLSSSAGAKRLPAGEERYHTRGRSEILPDGGLQFPAKTRYVHPRCEYLHVDVEFELVKPSEIASLRDDKVIGVSKR